MAKTQKFDPRQSMNGDTYEVFHYLDAKTRHLEAHYHDFYEIFCFVNGEVDYWVDGKVYHLKSGDVLLINPTELHKPIPLKETEDYERIVVWVSKSFLAGIENGILARCFDPESPLYGKVLRPSAAEQKRLFDLARNMTEENYGDTFGGNLCTYGMLLQFLVQINRISLSGMAAASEKSAVSTLISEVLKYVNVHFREKLTLEQLSSLFFVNKYYLSHQFKKTVGTGIHRYITMKRLNAAYELLEEGVPAGRAGSVCGFTDYTVFFRAFKNEFGISPTLVFSEKQHEKTESL